MLYWHEPPIWSMTVYGEEVGRGLVGHGGLHSPPRCLCPPLTPPSHRPAAIYHSWDWSELEMWRGWGVASLFNHPQLQHTHTRTHLHPWLPPPATPTLHSAMPLLPLYPTPPTCSRWIIDVALRLKRSAYTCVCVFGMVSSLPTMRWKNTHAINSCTYKHMQWYRKDA